MGTVMVVGGGGREHALAWACLRTPGTQVLCAPGNAGTAEIATNLDIAATDAAAIAAAAREHGADLVVVGPDAALEAGVADACRAAGIAVFGPDAAAARLETSKSFAKEVMGAAGIPTARWVAATATDRDAALAFIADTAGRCVVKADGLALGKGVTVCDDAATAAAALHECLDEGRFGAAGEHVVVEERLDGREVSVFAICDGNTARLMPPACDYKRALDGDLGPNTGGMGAYTPPQGIDTPGILDFTAHQVVGPCLAEMRRRGTPFVGCLYVGLMLTAAGPRVLEFNARFGDPETEALLPLIDEDVVALLAAAAAGEGGGDAVRVSPGASVCVVVATGGYPATGGSGEEISLSTPPQGAQIFHAGTRRDPGGVLRVSGGRVFDVVGTGDTLAGARTAAYAAVTSVSFAGMRVRGDIAAALPPPT